MSTTSSAVTRTSAPRSWGGTCSGPSAGPGRTSPGRAGGATTRRTTTTSSSTPTTRARPWRWPHGTTFHFTDEPPETVLARAFEAADGKDVRIGGGAATIRQYLRAGLIDELHLVIAPMLVGRGERLLDNLGDGIDGYRVAELVGSSKVTHAVLVRR